MSTIITYYGHSTLGLEIDHYHVIVDPFFDGNDDTRIKPSEVNADYLLVTHGHGDHLGDTEEIARRCGAVVVGASELCKWLDKKGGIKVSAHHMGGGVHYPFGYVKLTFALHGGGLPDGGYGGGAAGFLVTTPDQKKIYFAGDTGLFGDMRLIGEEGVDLALLPIGDRYTMGPEDALRAVRLIQPKNVIPIHYHDEGIMAQDGAAWVKRVNAETETKAHLVRPGESFTL